MAGEVMKAFLLTSLLVGLLVGSSYAYELLPFCTDGCSVVGNKTKTSFLCCVDHDIAYWAGGSKSDKYKADGRFYQCLLKTEGQGVAETYSAAVAVYGDPYWGLDWVNRPRFMPLTEEEKQIAAQKLPANPQLVFCGEDSTRRAIAVPIGPLPEDGL
jgi:hypothetical protein